ncbi:hypothetical protein MFM001_26720 [Mycobacterium sp. MFM001]|uniref:DUF732 domain-containing protein n=1 Tax=Mycobacterium sp. MFM001 TaxID=2049453 RepID=UPI000DA5416B|nr:DUF732 domain-containing protein [Mycobacterium sp. MFM001]GBE66210.1 hypothetical protein MFM001_26720 [Mycobacterium sp. MFM001]
MAADDENAETEASPTQAADAEPLAWSDETSSQPVVDYVEPPRSRGVLLKALGPAAAVVIGAIAVVMLTPNHHQASPPEQVQPPTSRAAPSPARQAPPPAPVAPSTPSPSTTPAPASSVTFHKPYTPLYGLDSQFPNGPPGLNRDLDEQFLSTLRERQYTVETLSGRTKLFQSADFTCTKMSQGNEESTRAAEQVWVIDQLTPVWGMDSLSAIKIVNAAIDVYCPA